METSFGEYRIVMSEKQEKKKAKFHITYFLMLKINLEKFPPSISSEPYICKYRTRLELILLIVMFIMTF